MTKIRRDVLKKLVRNIASTRAEELDCGGCFDQLETFVEKELAGVDVAQAMPKVRQHLDQCNGCCEQYEALLEALSGLEANPN